MARKRRHAPERVIGKLREAEVKLAKGTAIAQVCEDPAITENTYDRRRREYGGMEVDQARRLKDLEKENGRPKRLLADAELDKAIPKEAAAGNVNGGGKCSARRWPKGGGNGRHPWSDSLPHANDGGRQADHRGHRQ